MSSAASRRAAPANPLAATGVFALTSNPALACTISASGKYAVEGKRFRVRAEGNVVVAAGTTTWGPQILAVVGYNAPANPLTIASWTALKAASGVACPTTGCPWWIEADLILDSVSGLMHGTMAQVINNAYTAPAAITGVLTGINGTNLPVLQGSTNVPPSDPIVTFAVGSTYGAAGANTANLINFELSF